MEPFLLTGHVLAGILFLGPMAVTTSLFPRLAAVVADAATERDGERSAAPAQLLHRITRKHGVLTPAAPVMGLALAGAQDRRSEVQIVAAMDLTAAAGGLAALRIMPGQQESLQTPVDSARLTWRTRILALAPVIGGLFTLVNVRRRGHR